jgi:hypothetical protein
VTEYYRAQPSAYAQSLSENLLKYLRLKPLFLYFSACLSCEFSHICPSALVASDFDSKTYGFNNAKASRK